MPFEWKFVHKILKFLSIFSVLRKSLSFWFICSWVLSFLLLSFSIFRFEFSLKCPNDKPNLKSIHQRLQFNLSSFLPLHIWYVLGLTRQCARRPERKWFWPLVLPYVDPLIDTQVQLLTQFFYPFLCSTIDGILSPRKKPFILQNLEKYELLHVLLQAY